MDYTQPATSHLKTEPLQHIIDQMASVEYKVLGNVDKLIGQIHYVRTSYQSPAWSDSLPSNPLVERDVIQPRFSLLFGITEAIYPLNLWLVFKLPVLYLP